MKMTKILQMALTNTLLRYLKYYFLILTIFIISKCEYISELPSHAFFCTGWWDSGYYEYILWIYFSGIDIFSDRSTNDSYKKIFNFCLESVEMTKNKHDI